MSFNPVFESVVAPRKCARSFGLNCLAILAALCLFPPQLAHSQLTETGVATNPRLVSNAPAETETALETNAPPMSNSLAGTEAAATANISLPPDVPLAVNPPPENETTVVPNSPAEFDTGETPKTRAKKPVESEIAVNGMISYGDHQLFGAALQCDLWTAGVEYDRHFWPNVLKARMDYVVDFLPVVILSEPTVADFWGNPRSNTNKLVPGIGITPFGFRALWRSDRRIKPFLTGKAGVVAFPIKVLSPDASYVSLAFQGEFGLEIRLTRNVELRADPFTYFHFSNAFIVASNPGLDEFAAKVGISYHLNK